MLDAWAGVLRAVPSSRLLVYRDTLRGRAAERLRSRLAARGLAEDRLEPRCEGSSGHLGVYGDIDVLLDAWPWGGHATACEALWQGVPVLTLRGDRHAGRMVASVMGCVGLGHWVAQKPDDFVAHAVKIAADLEALAALRSGLRETVRRSVLCDGAAFTRHLEATYRQLWQRVNQERHDRE